MSSHHRPWLAHTVGRRRPWHEITALGQHTLSNNVGCGMTSLPLDSTNGRQRWAWHDITALGQHTPSNDVGRGMTSPPLDNTHGRMKFGMTCHHHLWKANTFKQRRAWIEITAFGLHARLDNVARGMTSPPLDSTHGQQCWAWQDITALGQHTRSDNIGRGITSPPLGSTHGQTTSGVA